MLVLSRRLNESILIGDDVRITVCYIDGGKVRLAIEAPRSTPVWREELLPRDRTTGKAVQMPSPHQTPAESKQFDSREVRYMCKKCRANITPLIGDQIYGGCSCGSFEFEVVPPGAVEAALVKGCAMPSHHPTCICNCDGGDR